MTSEIAILNNSGIALAADSAVTIGNEKVYNSANKVFTLSKYQPVGIMVYDSADLMGIPWETIIKECRSSLGDTCFPTLEGYANYFFDFIGNNNNLIPAYIKKNYVEDRAYNHLNMIYSELKDLASKSIETDKETTLKNSLKDLNSIIDLHYKIISDAQFLDGFSNKDVNKFCETWQDEFEVIASNILGVLFNFIASSKRKKLNKIIAFLFFKDEFLYRNTGVVVAGYGSEEVFPQIASYLVEGVFENTVKKKFNKYKSNIHKDSFITTIIPFAQDEMVWTFFRGIDPDIQKFSDTFLDLIFKEYPNFLDNCDLDLDDQVADKLKEILKNDGEKMLDSFRKELVNYQQTNITKPILDMVQALPKDELAAMAESLVNLTVFKRKVTKSMETVGGPIDVAVISKGDGFIWVKRKHYFQPELNQHFFSNYFRKECTDGNKK